MSGQPPNRGSFVPGLSGNPGGRPAGAEISALARRYTADWVTGLVNVVRLPVNSKNAPSIVSAARELREVGYPGLTKGAPEGSPSIHLHLLAVSPGGAPSPQEPATAAVVDGWGEWTGEDEPPLDERLMPRGNPALPHEALPLWDVAPGAEGEGSSEPRSD